MTVHELRRESLEVRGYLVLFADTTDVQRRAEQRRLSESLAHMGELTAGIAHEMRNSLTSLRGYLTRAEKQTAESPLRHDLDEIRHEADHLKRILDDFLSFAQPGSVRMTEVSLERVVRRAASDLEVAGKSVTIQSAELDGKRVIRRVWGDEQLLERALRNLLQNAADAEEEAGRASRSLMVRIDLAATSPTITVEDRGHRPATRDRAPSVRPVLLEQAPGHRPRTGARSPHPRPPRRDSGAREPRRRRRASEHPVPGVEPGGASGGDRGKRRRPRRQEHLSQGRGTHRYFG